MGIVFAACIGIALWANVAQLPTVSGARRLTFLLLLVATPPITALILFLALRVIESVAPTSGRFLLIHEPRLGLSFVLGLPVSILIWSSLQTAALKVLLSRWDQRSLIRFCIVGFGVGVTVLSLQAGLSEKIGPISRDSLLLGLLLLSVEALSAFVMGSAILSAQDTSLRVA